MKAGPLRVGAFRIDPAQEQAIARVQGWTRDRFELLHGATVMVSELECLRPNCPPLETVVAFWLEDGERRHFRVFKPLRDVVAADLPPAWLKDFLCAERDDEFDCC